MSILHICCNLAGSTVFPQLFESLCLQEIEQTVFVPEKYESNVGKNRPEGVSTHYALTVKRTDAVFFFRKAQRSVPEIEKTVDLSRVSLLHAHTLFTDGSIARALHKKHGIPYVVTLRYSDMEAIWRYEPHLRPMARRILRDASRVVFLSSAARDKVLLTWLSQKDREQIQKKTEVIPNGIKPQWLDGAPRSAPHDPVCVGFVGLLNDRKRPLDMLAAVHRANEMQTDMRFSARICGKGPLEAQVKERLQGGDAYVGRVEGMEAMKRFYADCDVLLVPSRAETFGMVYLEAMSQGVPVLYTKGQGFDGQFPDGEVGFSVVSTDVSHQAEKLLDVMKDYDKRSARCAELAKRYAWPDVAGRWAQLYRSVSD